MRRRSKICLGVFLYYVNLAFGESKAFLHLEGKNGAFFQKERRKMEKRFFPFGPGGAALTLGL